MSHLLEVRDLEVKFALRSGDITAIDGVSFNLDKGEKLGIVGESGAGKSVTGFSIINLISKPGYISKGTICFEGKEISSYSDEQMRKIRGNRISMIFQDPMMTLNPVFTIGFQMVETIQAHRKISKADAQKIALEKLRKVHIPSP
ncbi:MAG: ATP-binding cassette domain-containing protein, partial [Proteobacteria bacterium]|nr:ATP-binding cassette domain-containing protein [Pseudomonadota bacterium]